MKHSSEPNYVLKDGKLNLNAAGRDLTERMSEMSRAVERLNRSWTGAFIASLFVARPWLASSPFAGRHVAGPRCGPASDLPSH